MFNRYFQQEMNQLRELGADFAKAYPALAPMLSGPVADPDVERLLEGVSFQTALLRQKLDDDFPEIIQDLIRIIWPHYLRPIPSTSTVAFTPKPTLRQPATIPAGTPLASVPVEGTSCLFRTCSEVEIHPLSIVEGVFEQPSGQPPQVRLVMELGGLKLADWRPKSLRFFLAGDYAGAADLYFLLMRHLKRIVLRPLDGGEEAVLPRRMPQGGRLFRKRGPHPLSAPCLSGLPRPPGILFFTGKVFVCRSFRAREQWRGRGAGRNSRSAFELITLPVRPPG